VPQGNWRKQKNLGNQRRRIDRGNITGTEDFVVHASKSSKAYGSVFRSIGRF
jgi:hypothetical protein